MNLRAQQVYNFHISKFLGTDLRLFELAVWLHAFGLAMISVFMPIILYQIGLSLPGIVIFYMLFNVIDVPLNLLARKVIEKRGARTAVIMATSALVLYFVLLYNLYNNWTMIFALAALLAFYDSFYWVGHLYIFAKSAHHTSRLRSDVSMLSAIRILGGLVAPIVGAYILIYAHERTLIFAATLVMMASLIPLFRMRRLVFKPEEPTKSISEFLQQPQEKTNYWFSVLAGIRAEVSDVIWPFFVFFIFGSLKTVAYIPMLIALASLVLTLVAGKLSLKRNIYRMIALASLCVAVIWAARLAFYSHEFFAVGSVLLIALLGVFVDIPLDVAIFQRAGQTGELAATTYLNLVRMAGRAVLYIVLLGALAFGVNYFILSFWLVTALMVIQFIWGLVAGQKHYLHLLGHIEGVAE